MRILAVTNLYPNPFEPNRGTFNRQQFRALAEIHALHVLSPISWVDEARARLRGKAALPPSRRVTCDGISVEHPRYYYPPGILRSRYGHWYEWSIRSLFERAVEVFRPDLIFAPWAYPDGWAAVNLGRQAGLPVVVKVHGSDILWSLWHHADRRERTREALLGADAVVAVSEDLARHVHRLDVAPERVRVVYDGIDAQLFHPGPRAEARSRLGLDAHEPTILFVGNLLPVKGLDLLITACAQLVNRGQRFRCYLVGQGLLRAQLAAQIKQLGLTERVILMGPRPHAQLPDWFRSADVFVLPSRSEGLPCVLLEASACGRPFVASAVGGIPEIARAGRGRLFPPGDASRLADALEAELTDPNHVAETSAWKRSHEEAASDLTALFDAVLSRRERAESRRPTAAVSC